jgi:transposase
MKYRMNKFRYYVGVDVSKDVFDAVLLDSNVSHVEPIHNQFKNSIKGCRQFDQWLCNQGVEKGSCLICMEHTGMYINILVAYSLTHSLPIWVEMSYRIIRSSGIQRGKSDRIDAFRIAQYASKYSDQAVLYEPKQKVIRQIHALLKLREGLVRKRASLLRIVKEYQRFDPELSKLLIRHQKKTVKGIDQDLERIEESIKSQISEDEEFKRLFTIVTSIPGVGKITAMMLICYTNGFSSFENPRQLACYCGVVPFEYTSGKSIKGRPRVHFMANKKLKQLLLMCALNASKCDPELKHYYQRKQDEGKSKMLVLNNIRNKLIHRICACVKDNRLFQVKNVELILD